MVSIATFKRHIKDYSLSKLKILEDNCILARKPEVGLSTEQLKDNEQRLTAVQAEIASRMS